MLEKKTKNILFPIGLFISCFLFTLWSLWWESVEPKVIIFWDYYIYYSPVIDNFWNSEGFYGLNYFPSFFFLSPLYVTMEVYIVFLTICWIISIFLLFKLEKNYWIVLGFSFLAYIYILIGNIEPFSFLVVLIAFIYEDDRYIPPIILAFICFKITMFLVVPYFFFKAKKRFLFILIFVGAFLLLNFEFLIHLDYIPQFLTLGASDEDNLLTKLIRVSIFYTAYYILKDYRISHLTEESESQKD